MKSWFQDNDTEMYSIHNEGKSAVSERFVRTIKNKIYKYMTSISKYVYIDQLDDINQINNTYYSTIKIKPFDVKSSTYIDSHEVNNKEYPKFKIGDRVKISNYTNIFVKGNAPNWSEEDFVIKKVKNIVQWTYVVKDLNEE